MAYYIGNAGAYARKANVSVPDSAVALQESGPDFNISKPWTGPGGVLSAGRASKLA